MISISFVLVLPAVRVEAEKNPIEVGSVHWQRDLGAALRKSALTGRPVFMLFQEVPGCAGCRDFGARVLSNPLLVEAIEDEFVPVLVYNNRKGGEDERLLKRFKEPPWNYQVVRFIDARGRDILPRRDRVWSLGGIASRAIEALEAAKRPVPKYLEVVAAENATEKHGVSAFAMPCFWVGERELGRIEGVISTEAGWLEGREVTRVVYRKDILTLKTLAERAAEVECARKVYAPGNEARALTTFSTGQFNSQYQKAKASDQKKQIAQWPALGVLPGITAMQMTKINALAPSDGTGALAWLSPRQRQALRLCHPGWSGRHAPSASR